MVLLFATVRRVTPGQISIVGFSRFILAFAGSPFHPSSLFANLTPEEIDGKRNLDSSPRRRKKSCSFDLQSVSLCPMQGARVLLLSGHLAMKSWIPGYE
jgi:hypothetical protein